MSRNAIKQTTDTVEITKRLAAKLGLPLSEVKKEVNFFWVDVDMVFTHNCGYSVYVEKFGTFWIYTQGVYGIALDIEKRIRKLIKIVSQLKALKLDQKAETIMAQVCDLMTRLIFLDYTIKQYKKDVLSVYPKKYKIGHEAKYQSVIKRLVELFNIPLHKFPITINHPVQEMYVRHLRREGVLRNPVVSRLKTYRGQYKKS